MVLVFWWMPVLLSVGGAVYIISKKNRYTKKKTTDKKTLIAANTDAFTGLPEYQTIYKKYVLLVRLSLFAFLLIFIATIILASRPAAESIIQPESHNRDIMLCLDVSGSMAAVDAKVVDTFAELADGFKGERIGLTIFDSSAISLFPLTNDYGYIKERLTTVSKALQASGDLNNNDYVLISDIYSGTGEGEGSSLVGDGVASCIMRFDNLEETRARSIILATDNFVNGSPVITMREAGTLAKEKKIRLYGLNPNDDTDKYYVDEVAQEYREVVLATQGAYYKFTDTSAVPGILEQVKKQEATRFKGAPVLVKNEKPAAFIYSVMLLMAVYICIRWRLEL